VAGVTWLTFALSLVLILLFARYVCAGDVSSDDADGRPALGPSDPEFTGLSGEQIRQAMSGPYPDRRARPSVPFHRKPMHPGRSAAVDRRQVKVELLEESGLDRVGEPVRFGFPLPEGVLFDPSEIRLLSPVGAEHPAQFTITSFWKDSSIRWLLVTFMADLKAGAKATYTIEFGSKVRRSTIPEPVHFSQVGDALLVDTGPMRVQVNTKMFSLFDKIWLDANGDGRFAEEELAAESAPGGIIMTVPEGKQYTTSAAPVEFRVEEQGPLTLSLRFEGPYADSSGKSYFRHVTRLRFFAGSTIIGVAHSHIDDFLEHEFADFASVQMPLELKGRAGEAHFLMTGLQDRFRWQAAPLTSDEGVRLFQRDDSAFTLSGADLGIQGKRAPGVVELRGPEGALVSAAVEDFWQNYPGAIRANDDGLIIGLWPDIHGVAEYKALPDHLRFPFVGDGYRFKWGMSKTHHVWLSFGPQSTAGLGTASLVPVLPATWYEETNALGPMVAKRHKEFEVWDEAFEECFQSHLARKETAREYGFFNWGDWYGERGTNWGNNEYDLPHALFMQFARTGDRRYFRLALAGARHQADVDCIHAYPDPAFTGGNVLHSICHTGEWSQTIPHRSWSHRYGYLHMAFNGHTWSEGMCDTWYLTGDAGVMETAQALGEHIVYGMQPRFKELGTHERSAGWSLQAIVALYRATLDPLYLEAARKIAEIPFKEQKLDGNGVWPHTLPADHCRHSSIPGAKRCEGNVAFLIGVLYSGLKEYYLVSGDPQAQQSLTAASPWWKTMWEPESGSFRYTSCPLFRGQASLLASMTCADAVAYAYELTGDVEYLDMVAQVLMANASGRPSGFGKSLGHLAQHASRVMAVLRKHQDKSPEAKRAVHSTREDMLSERMANGAPAPFFGVRSPAQKRFYVLNPGGRGCGIHIERQPHGSRPKDKPTGSITVRSSGGKVIEHAEFSTDDPYQIDVELPASSDKRPYTVEISDDMRGIWDIADGEAKIVLDCGDELSVGNYKSSRLYFFVPADVKSFEFEILPVHKGAFTAAVFDGSNKAHGLVSGNKGGFEAAGANRTISVSVPRGAGGKIWSIVLLAGGDMGLRMKGIPPYLSRTPEGWFDPGTR